MSVLELLQEAKCAERAPLTAACTMEEWKGAYESDGRPAFLKMLVSLGFDKLAERQAIANAIGRARREGRL